MENLFFLNIENKKDLLSIIEKGNTYYIDLQNKIDINTAKTICAFANKYGGGIILITVNSKNKLNSYYQNAFKEIKLLLNEIYPPLDFTDDIEILDKINDLGVIIIKIKGKKLLGDVKRYYLCEYYLREESKTIKKFELPFKYQNNFSFSIKPLFYYSDLHIPPAEQHVIISDWYDDPKQWYAIPKLITELYNQSYICYNKNLFVSSLLCSINAIELIVKYEYVRIFKNPDKLSENFTFGSIFRYLEKINLESFSDDLKLINEIRIGIYHYNIDKINKIMVKLNLEVKNFHPAYLNVNSDFIYLARFTYNFLLKIIWKLYNCPEKYFKHQKEGLDDFRKKYVSSNV
jgi:hypothetical protein